MEKSEEQIAIKVFIDCPVCRSGNSFQLEDAGEGSACGDCGFVLAGATEPGDTGDGRCVFCGGASFYLESPLPLLGKDSVCYVCEAKYSARVHTAEQQFSSDSHAEAQNSDAAKRWQQRIEMYEQGAA